MKKFIGIATMVVLGIWLVSMIADKADLANAFKFVAFAGALWSSILLVKKS